MAVNRNNVGFRDRNQMTSAILLFRLFSVKVGARSKKKGEAVTVLAPSSGKVTKKLVKPIRQGQPAGTAEQTVIAAGSAAAAAAAAATAEATM